jgi:hypothetical protein
MLVGLGVPPLTIDEILGHPRESMLSELVQRFEDGALMTHRLE